MKDMKEWKSRRPKNFKSDADKNVEKLWKNGVFNKLKGVNLSTMHRETLESEDVKNEDESHRLNVTISSSNPK
jgi:hypothetical protein